MHRGSRRCLGPEDLEFLKDYNSRLLGNARIVLPSKQGTVANSFFRNVRDCLPLPGSVW